VPLSVSNAVIDRLEKKLHDSFDLEDTTFQCEYERDDEKEMIVQFIDNSFFLCMML